MAPDQIGIDSSIYTITYNGTTTSCNSFYNDVIKNKYSDAANKLIALLNKRTTGNLTSSSYIDSITSAGADVNSTWISGNIGKFYAYSMNVAALGPINNAFRNYLTDINSGQDVANAITAGASIADLQAEGAGKFKWMAEIIPLGFHYMLGIIYSISILIMIVATALGYQKGMMVWKNFAKGLLTFEFIKIALVIVNSTVNQYAAYHAADMLASIGQNPASISSLPYYLNYIASMTGIAGMLGLAAIFMIPGMVFSGEVAMAAGAIGGLASKYKGNDIQTATEISAKQKATEEAWENDLRDQAKLDRMGISVPQGMGAGQFYSQYQREAQAANAGFGAARMGTGAMDQAGVAVKGQTMQSIQSGATLAANTSMEQFVSAGVTQGAMGAGDVQGMAAASSLGASAIAKGKAAQTAKGVATTAGYGEEVDTDMALSMGKLSGKAMAKTDIGTYEGAIIGGVDNFLKGTENQAAKKSATTAGYGKEGSLKSAIDAGNFAGIEAGSADNTLSANQNLEGDARTSGRLGIDKKLQAIHGAQKAQIYNTDGSAGHEHAKFISGGTELERQALNKNQLAMGAAMAGKSEDEKRQMMADLQAGSAGKILDEFSNMKGARTGLNVGHDKDNYIESVDNSGTISWTDTNGKKHSMSRSGANKLLAEAGIMGTVGKAAGIYSRTDKGQNLGVLANNAMGMEAGNISSMNAAITNAGGVSGFAGMKAAQSAIQTTESIKTMEGKIAEGLKKSHPEMSNEEAEKLSKAIVKGSKEGAEKFKDALKALGDLAGTKAGAQTGADMASVAKAENYTSPVNGEKGFSALQRDLATGKVSKDIGTIKGAETRGGFDVASFKSGVESGAGMGAAYDNMAALTGTSDPSKIAQTLHNRTSMTDTKRHLIEDIGTFGLDKLNKTAGTDFKSEEAAALALMGGGTAAAEIFQALRGQKGPIRKLGEKIPNPLNKRKTNPNNPSANHNNSDNLQQSYKSHDDASLKKSITNHTEDLEINQAQLSKNEEKLEDLRERKKIVGDAGKDTSHIDDEILKTKKNIGNNHNEISKSQAHIDAIDNELHSRKGSKLKTGLKTGAAALTFGFADDIMDGMGIDISKNRAAFALHNSAAFVGDVMGAGFEVLSGAAKGLGQSFTGNFSGALDTIFNSMSVAASNALNSYNTNVASADERFKALNSTPRVAQTNPMQNPNQAISQLLGNGQAPSGGGGSDDVFNQSAFMQNMQSSVDMGSFQSLKASQIASRNIGMAEEMRENMEYSNENFQEQLTNIMNGIEEANDGYY